MRLSISSFFSQLIAELKQSIYLALGGTVDDGINFSAQGLKLASITIKIAILLSIIGFFYWLLVYVVKHLPKVFPLSHKYVRMMRASLRYMCFVLCALAFMSQIGINANTVKAFAKASAWAGVYYVLWMMSNQLMHKVLRHYKINESIHQLLQNLMSVLVLMMAAAAILAQFGFDIISIVAGLGIVGLAVGFAAQSTLANFIAGITILIEQSFEMGDWIRIGEQEGRVVKITLRTTHILSRDNITIILPNSTVASSEVINLTSKTFVRFDVPMRVGLNADIDEVRVVLLKTLKNNTHVLSHPLPSVTLTKVGEYELNFIVRFWLSPDQVARLPVIKEFIIEELKKALDAAGIYAPYPHLKLVDKMRTRAKGIIIEDDFKT